MFITYITTTRNRPFYLLSCAYSVLAQLNSTDINWIIIIDDEYKKYEQVIKIIKKWIPKVVIYSEGRVGRNKALRIAHQLVITSHIVWLDDDDLLSPIATTTLLEYLTYDLVYSDFYVIGKNNKIVISGRNKVPYKYTTMLKFNCIFHLTMYSLNLFKKCGGINPEYNCSIDYELRLRQLEYTEPVKINKALYYYREHENRMTNYARLEQKKNYKKAVIEAKIRNNIAI